MTEVSPEKQAIIRLCIEHLQTCKKPRCFTRHSLFPSWFNVPIEDLEGECVPDSLQPGHGVLLKIPRNYSSRIIQKPGEPDLFCSNLFQEGEIKITCRCPNPQVHPRLIDQLCKQYNKV